VACAAVAVYPYVAPAAAPEKTAPLTAGQEYDQGKELFAEGRYGEALACFDRAVNAEPENHAYKFARGRTRLKLGQDPSGALGDFDSVRTAHLGDPRPEEAVAYCQLLLYQFEPAISHLTTAERAGAKSYELYNNRAYAYLLRSNDQDRAKLDLKLAKADLEKALKEKEDCVPALYNRALQALLLWQYERNRASKTAFPTAVGCHAPLPITLLLAQAYLLAQAQADIEAVIVHNPTYGQLHMEAAAIYAASSPTPDSGIAERGRAHVREAVGTFGWDKNQVVRETFLMRRLANKGFADWLNTGAPPARPQPKVPPSLRLCDPIRGWLDK
jgi:tetratricopeptide (TPR) repeat protein